MRLAPVIESADPGHATACPFVQPGAEELVAKHEVTGA
jgi:hypothetical protein